MKLDIKSRINLDRQTVIITKADIILPPITEPWVKSKFTNKNIKRCNFILYYNLNSQKENYAGVRVFEKNDNKYSHPTITKDRKNQASHLMGVYADFKQKDINNITLKEFLTFLNSRPKARITVIDLPDEFTGKQIEKNIVSEFI